MADVVSPAVLQRLADRIEQLGKVEHVQIFRVLKVHGVKHTQNKNGCFMDISSAPPAAIAEVQSFVNYAAELDAERLAGTIGCAGGKQPQLLPPSQHRPPQLSPLSPMSQLPPPLSPHLCMVGRQSQAGAPVDADVDAAGDAAGDAAFSVAPASVDGSLADDAADEDPGGAAAGGGPANGRGGGENRRKETSRFQQLRRKYSKQVNTKVNISDDLDVE